MAHPELSHVPGIVSQFAHNVGLSLLGLMIESFYVFYQQDDLNTAAALSGWEKARTLGLPVWCIVCSQLDGSLSARHLSIFVAIASLDPKAQDVLKPENGLFEVAHTNLSPAGVDHGMPPPFACSFSMPFRVSTRSNDQGSRSQYVPGRA